MDGEWDGEWDAGEGGVMTPMEVDPMLRSLLENSGNGTAAEPEPEEEEEENVEAFAILVLMVLLGIAVSAGHFLEKKKISWMSEAGSAMLLGLVIGCIAKLTNISVGFDEWLSFQNNFFYFALLPPIIFEASYSLDVEPFFENIGAICAYAFVGTTLSTALIGLTMYIGGLMNICFKMTLVENLLFGSLISATDPVTVLAVFQRLNADPDLYTLVFGESIFNDAVAIVLYRSLSTFRSKAVTTMQVLRGIGTFIEIFLVSMLVGVGVAMLASLAFRTKKLRNKHHPLEATLVVLFALSSFFAAESLKMSGIVSILFCGITMSRYTRPNLSSHGEKLSISFFKVLASSAETFVFIYIGTTLFLKNEAWTNKGAWAYLVLGLFALAHSRFANIGLNTSVINALRPREIRVPNSHAFLMWWAGLRGAVAFNLAIKASVTDFTGDKKEVGQVFLTTTFFMVLITVLVNGGSTQYFLDKFKLRIEDPRAYTRLSHSRSGNLSIDLGDNTDAQNNGGRGLLGKVRELNRAGISMKLKKMDEKYLARFFGADVEMVERNQTKDGGGEGHDDDGDREGEVDTLIGPANADSNGEAEVPMMILPDTENGKLIENKDTSDV